MSADKNKRAAIHNLAHKISAAKRFNLQMALASASTRMHMMLHPLPVRQYLDEIDEQAVEAIRRRCYGDSRQNTSTEGLKYLDFRKYMSINVKRVCELALDRVPPQRVLDLGSGAGYFLFVCRHLGHDCLGLDTNDVPAYEEMMKLLGVPRVTWRIEPFAPLPDLGAPFDVITAHQMVFNGRKSSGFWKTAEWEFFLHDLRTHLKPHGRIFLRFNKERKDCYISEELIAFFRSQGAAVGRTSVRFDLGKADSGANGISPD